eukprot:symbB.v1.2.013325.t1/scaffold938.1/size150240/18
MHELEEDTLPPERVDHKLDVPPPTTDLASAYDAALSSLLQMHSQILEALRTHQEQEMEMMETTEVLKDQKDQKEPESIKDSPQTHHVAEVMVTDQKVPNASLLKRTFSVVTPAAEAGESEEVPRQRELQELSAHHGVDLLEWKGPPSEDMARDDLIGRVVQHNAFDGCASVMIFVNSIFIAIETQWMTTNFESPLVVQVMNYICSLFFLVELILRMIAYRIEFFTRPGSRGWNIFDLCLVL